MLRENDAIKVETDKATISRMWSHTIGIVNEKRRVVTMPDGRRFLEELPGTASVIKWGEHRLILTANHVIENADKGDLRFFFQPAGKLEQLSLEEIERQGYVENDRGRPVEIYNIFRCNWEDIAVLTISPKSEYLNAEPFDFMSAYADPLEGENFSSVGFPTHDPLPLAVNRTGKFEERILGLVLTRWDSTVIQKPSSFVESYSAANPFDPERHFLAPWQPSDSTMGLHGFSGAAVLTFKSAKTLGLWSFNLVFGGMCTHYYKSAKLGRMIKASVVKKFLQETLPRAKRARAVAR